VRSEEYDSATDAIHYPFSGWLASGFPSSDPDESGRSVPVMALKGPSTYTCQCLLIVHDQTYRGRTLTAEFDPSRTSSLVRV
jgi:hypothetical protein